MGLEVARLSLGKIGDDCYRQLTDSVYPEDIRTISCLMFYLISISHARVYVNTKLIFEDVINADLILLICSISQAARFLKLIPQQPLPTTVSYLIYRTYGGLSVS